ncbi:SafA/ExsA family spore coat assembly protein [Rossellomorea aquimaris]|uniref:SafA/ExsA family spore coat assembly protein n=1 Tax=Rossellomorea aquimaris TaxID=189382 RepID=UPI001CD609D9|nr:SafA/ExsA family spore coat assembly protein [Rossellomorea aquimaris]MCA1057062.1 SafA/ExsA family spore coat assembly protein [Rossellomorea aquimaris]
MKTLLAIILVTMSLAFGLTGNAHAQAERSYMVKKGDTLWKISKRFRVGLSEIIDANPQIPNPDLIYPGQSIHIPTIQSIKSVERQVIDLTNQERQKAGLSPLQLDWQLSRVARYKSRDMRDTGYFAHRSPQYGSPFDMMKSFNIQYSSAGENIAVGQTSPEQVVREWMNSPGHRKNILNGTYTRIGVGYAKGGSYGTYWTQMFISK